MFYSVYSVAFYNIAFYGGNKFEEHGTGFIVHKEIKTAILKFDPVNEKMCSLRVKAKFFSLTLFCVYALTKEAKRLKKEFYG